MRLLKILALPALVFVVAAIYWVVSSEPAGSALLVIFGISLILFSWALLPTFGDVGPTAPVDPDWHERDA